VSGHLGDPCIHCGAPHDDVELGPCPKAGTIIASVRAVEHLKSALEKHLKASAAVTAGIKTQIATHETAVSRTSAGLDTVQIQLAETVMYVRGEYSRAGEEKGSAKADAIKWFATGKSPAYLSLKSGYFGTKSYDRWNGQRCDCEYGMGPRHGSIIFEIGLKADARKRDLTDAEREACAYYLLNLECVQQTKVAA
jgi:hypothetical protein